jgi:hypothetical protein
MEALFSKGTWAGAARELVRQALDEVREVERPLFSNPALAGRLEDIVSRHSFDVAVLNRDGIRGSRREVPGIIDDFGMRKSITKTVLDVAIPFRGDPTSFQLAPSFSHHPTLLCAVRGDDLVISVEDDADAQRRVDDFVQVVSNNLDRLRSEVASWVPQLRAAVMAAGEERRKELEKQRERDGRLSFPVE